MSKKSVYIAQKSKVLFDMYAELDVLKASKKSDANDAMVRRRAASPRRAAHAVVLPFSRSSPRRAVFTLAVRPVWQIASAQKSIDAFILRHNISKKSPLTGIRTGY